MSIYIIKHENNKLEQINLRKFWNGIPISTLTDEEKLEHGWYRAEIVNSSFNPLYQTQNPKPILQIDEETGRGLIFYQVETLPLDTIKQNYLKKIDEIVSEKMETGVEYKETCWTATDRGRDTLLELIEVSQKTNSPVSILDAKNNIFSLNLSELNELRDLGLLFRSQLHEWRIAKYTQIQISSSLEEILQISLEYNNGN